MWESWISFVCESPRESLWATLASAPWRSPPEGVILALWRSVFEYLVLSCWCQSFVVSLLAVYMDSVEVHECEQDVCGSSVNPHNTSDISWMLIYPIPISIILMKGQNAIWRQIKNCNGSSFWPGCTILEESMMGKRMNLNGRSSLKWDIFNDYTTGMVFDGVQDRDKRQRDGYNCGILALLHLETTFSSPMASWIHRRIAILPSTISDQVSELH